MKRLLILNLIILCVLVLVGTSYALSGYGISKPLTINGSTADDYTGAMPIVVSPYANPIETGSWTINSKTYNNRIAIPIREVTGTNLTDYLCMIEINTEWLDGNGYFEGSAVGDEVEYDFGTSTYGLNYHNDSATFGTERDLDWVEISITALTLNTLYMYVDVDITASSTNSKTTAELFSQITIAKQVSASTDDCNVSNPTTIDLSGNVQISGKALNQDLKNGYRFGTVGLPNNGGGLEIYEFGTCTLTLTALGSFDVGTAVYTRVTGHDADDSDTFSTISDFNGRARTTAYTDYDSTTAWGGDEQIVIDVADIVDEISSRTGWVENNDMSLFWDNNASANNNYRYAVSYDFATTKSAKLDIIAYAHPDYHKLPVIVTPIFQDVDVYLDGLAPNFPYGVAFTASGSSTPYYFVDIPETRRTGNNVAMTYVVNITDIVPQSGTLDIDVWYNNATEITWNATYYSATNATTDYVDFAFGTADVSVVSGTWSTENMQVPFYRGGVNSWIRPAVPVYADGELSLYGEDALHWTGLSLFNFSAWRYPSTRVHLTPNSVDDFTWVNQDYNTTALSNEDVSHPSNLFPISYPLSIQTTDGITYWMATFGYTEAAVAIMMLYSTTTPHDPDSWVYYSGNPIWTQGQDGSPDEICDGDLFWDASGNQWVLYLAYFTATNIHYATCSGTDPTAGFSYGAQCFNPTFYTEAISVIKDASTYYMFWSDLHDHPVTGEVAQRIGYSTCATATGTFTATYTTITMDQFPWNFQLSGMPKFFHDGAAWNMISVGQPQTANGLDDQDVDDQAGRAIVSSFPGTWTAQNIEKNIYHDGAGFGGLIEITNGSYENFEFRSPILLDYGEENAGIAFRKQDDSNYYYAVFDRSENNIKLYKNVAGLSSVLTTGALPFTMDQSGTEYHEAIYCYGSGIKVGVSQYGGQFDEVISTSDASLANSGGAGLIGLASSFYANNIIITDYIEPMPTITPGKAVVSFTPKCFPMF